MAGYSKNTIDSLKAIPIQNLFTEIESKGNKVYCQCPNCLDKGFRKSKWRGLTINTSKNVGICNECKFSVGGDALSVYAKINHLDKKKDFIKIIEGVAETTGTHIEKEDLHRKSEFDGRPIPGSFAHKQLQESGLTPEDIMAEVIIDDKIAKVPVFQRGSLNVNTGEINYFDNEMVILYFDLEGRRKKYIPKGARSVTRERDYTRVRWSNPESKSDKYGKPVKYQTPFGARSEIYIPQKIREAFKAKSQFDTLIIQEGEKKAEKACKHGIPSLGIQGIFNIGNQESGLPQEIQYIAEACGVKNIVLLFDSDWQDLDKKIDNDASVDRRPNQFAKAAIKFKRFVKTLHQIGLHVDIWFGHINKNNADAKGIDDLLVGPLNGREDCLKEDFKKAVESISGEGEFITLHNISTVSDYQIRDFWKLNFNEDFFEIHRSRLAELKSFRFDNVLYNVVDGKFIQNTEFGSGSDFWEVSYNDKGDKQIKLSIIDTKSFLEGNGFFSFVDEYGLNSFVRVDKGIIQKMSVPDIHRFIFSYVTKASRDREIHEFFASNIDTKLTPGKLNLLQPIITNAGIPEQYTQRFYYQNVQIAIDDSGITSEPLKGPVWEQNLIKREFSRIKIFDNVCPSPDGSFIISTTKEGSECEFLSFLKNSSSFLNNAGVEVLDYLHLINKLTCIGYLLRQYRSQVEKRAVIGVDTRMSEVGNSNGRSGKSLVGVAISKMLNQVGVDGRALKDSDDFIFTEVRKTTGNIFIDDVRVNFDFGKIYAAITGDINVNVKSGRRFTIPFEFSPKIYITTNHSIRSEGDSTEDRTIFMGFSPHYSIDNTPIMEFGHAFFSEWDDYQWTLFDNLMIECVWLYMQSIKLGWTKDGCGAIPPPMDVINKRRERQNMGEAFLQWAESYFAPDGDHINCRIPRKEMYQDFIKEYPQQKSYVSTTSFRTRLQSYCKFKEYYHLNPHKKHEKSKIDFHDWILANPDKSFFGLEDKSGGVEYFTVANDYYFQKQKAENQKLSIRSILDDKDDSTPF